MALDDTALEAEALEVPTRANLTAAVASKPLRGGEPGKAGGPRGPGVEGMEATATEQ